MVAVAKAPEDLFQVFPHFTAADVYHPQVHKLLRPALTRATLGNDKDCVELLVTLNTPNYRTVIVEEGQCGCCSVAGMLCVTAVKDVYTWSDDVTRPLEEVVARCVNCVLHHKYCDLPQRTRYPTCACDWQMPPSDRAILAKRAGLLMVAGHQLGLPISGRIPDREIAKLFIRLRYLNDWFLQRAEIGHQMRDLRALEPAMEALGVSELVRPDGKWIVPFRQDWQPCPCYPSSECAPERHYDAMSDLHDNDSELEDALLDKELARHGQIHPDRSADDWERVKGYPKHTPKIVALPDNELKRDDKPKKGTQGSKKASKGKARMSLYT